MRPKSPRLSGGTGTGLKVIAVVGEASSSERTSLPAPVRRRAANESLMAAVGGAMDGNNTGSYARVGEWVQQKEVGRFGMGTRRRVVMVVMITEKVKVKVMVTLFAGRWLRRRCGRSVGRSCTRVVCEA